MDLPASVEIVEVGSRDGLQSEKTNLSTPEKIALIEALAAAGLKRFEATSFVSPRAIPQLADAEDVLAGLLPADRVIYGGLIPNERGYERARRQPQRTRGGGNAATEDLVYMLTEMGIETGVALEPLMDAADLLERLVGHPLNTRIERSLLADSGLR